MIAVLPSLLRAPPPATSVGPATAATSGSDFPAAMPFAIACSLAGVSRLLLPAAWTTTGLEPLLWDGKRSLSRSVAFWLPVPGSESVSASCEPTAPAHAPRPMTAASQMAITGQRNRAQRRPRW